MSDRPDETTPTPASVLVGEPSDEVPSMLATGRTDVTTIYVSMSARHLP